MKENKNTVNKYAVCSRCANNGCKFCPRCDGYSNFRIRFDSPVVFNDKAKKQKEYQREYYQKNKKKIQEKRRAYFLRYYHEVLKKKPDEVTKKRLRGLKYYYDHHDEIRAKRNAKNVPIGRTRKSCRNSERPMRTICAIIEKRKRKVSHSTIRRSSWLAEVRSPAARNRPRSKG